MRVRELDVTADGELKLAGAPVNAAAQLLLGKRGEPPLDEIDPGGARRSEVHMEPRMTREPPVNRGRLVRTGVVEDQVHLEAGGHPRVDGGEELAKLAGALPLPSSAIPITRTSCRTPEPIVAAETAAAMAGPVVKLPATRLTFVVSSGRLKASPRRVTVLVGLMCNVTC